MAVSKPNLPVIPGYAFNSNVGKEFFGRHQYFELFKSGNKESRFFFETPNRVGPALYSKSRAVPNQPSWLIFEKEALVFDAYYQNTLDEMRYGPALLRIVKIFFFLQDGTMKVIEPRTLNSSHMQGTLLSRQRVPRPKLDGVYYDILDINVGREIDIFGKKFLLTDCDRFTRLFLNRLGINVPDPIVTPKDPCPRKGRKVQSIVAVERKSEKQFLEFDRKVLKFLGYWDNRASEGGKVVHLDIFYYLADDTMEIKLLLTDDDSTDVKPMFLKRSKLPKMIPTGLMSADVLHRKPVACFGPSDLQIGAPINVYGRMVILTQCDQFTKEYYRVNYGLDNFDPIEPPVPLVPPKPELKPRPLPPWNGIGTFQDSARNCKSLQPKASTQNFIQFFTKDKFGFNSFVLRFRAKIMNEKVPTPGGRYCMIRYFLNDDTMALNELSGPKSTTAGKPFFKRAAVNLPGQNLYVSTPPKTYQKDDMWLGNTLIINKHHFKLLDTDEYTLRYMELNPSDFPKADINIVMSKIRDKFSAKENLYKDFVAKNLIYVDTEKSHRMSKACFENALREIICEYLTEHEFLTVFRYFEDQKPDVPKKKSVIRTLIYEELLRQIWQDFDRLCEYIRYLDEYCTGVLSHKHLWLALKAVKIPLTDDVMEEMLCCIKKDNDGYYYIDDFLDFMNFKLKPPPSFVLRPSKSAKHGQESMPTFGDEVADRDLYINWDAFLKHLNLEHTVTQK